MKSTHYIVLSLLVVAGVSLLVMAAARGGSHYYVTVDQVASYRTQSGEYDRGESSMSGTLRVMGMVAEGTVKHGSGGDGEGAGSVSFTMTNKGERLDVVYAGVLPEMFEPGRQVVAQGTLDDSGVLRATRIMTKCASKYTSDPRVPHGFTEGGDTAMDGESSQAGTAGSGRGEVD